MLVKIEDEKHENENGRYDADHFRFGQEPLAGLDGFVDFPGVVYMQVAWLFFFLKRSLYGIVQLPICL